MIGGAFGDRIVAEGGGEPGPAEAEIPAAGPTAIEIDGFGFCISSGEIDPKKVSNQCGARFLVAEGIEEDAKAVFVALVLQAVVYKSGRDTADAFIRSFDCRKSYSLWDDFREFIGDPRENLGTPWPKSEAEEIEVKEATEAREEFARKLKEVEELFNRLGFNQLALKGWTENQWGKRGSLEGKGLDKAIEIAQLKIPDVNHGLEPTYDVEMLFIPVPFIGRIAGAIGRAAAGTIRLALSSAVHTFAKALVKFASVPGSRFALKGVMSTTQHILKKMGTSAASSVSWIVRRIANRNPLDSQSRAALHAIGLDDATIKRHLDLMGDIYLFRGTTEGFPGNDTLLRLGITPTTIDPAIAAVFAAEGVSKGANPVIIFGPRAAFARSLGMGNVRRPLEREVSIALLPAEFAAKAPHSISLTRARQILKELGFDIPSSFSSTVDATQFLESLPRMTAEQINSFLQKAGAK